MQTDDDPVGAGEDSTSSQPPAALDNGVQAPLPAIADTPPEQLLPPVIENVPPLLPPESRPEAPTPERKRPVLLYAVVVLLGIVQLVFAIKVAGMGENRDDPAYMAGTLIGSLVLWPAIVIGLFSIGRRFRTERARLIILLCVWGLFTFGQLGNIAKSRTTTFSPELRLAPAASTVEQDETVAIDWRVFERPEETEVRQDGFDLSTGSAERLVALVESTQIEQYRAIAAAYRRACELRPGDAMLAVERARFLQRFAYGEDFYIEGAEEELESAMEHLKSGFQGHPKATLVVLESLYGAGLETEAAKLVEVSKSWPHEDSAKLYLLRAGAAEATKSMRTLAFARESLRLNPTADAAILVAEKAVLATSLPEALDAASNPVLEDASPWIQKRRLDVLFDCGGVKVALELFDRLKDSRPEVLNDAELALHLADAGRVADARKILRNIPINDWNRTPVLRARFKFEMEHGDGDSAAGAYKELAALGVNGDPFLRDKFNLIVKHSRLAWSVNDLVGVFMAAFVLVGLGLAPLVFLLPAHYWSLLRARKGKAPGWIGSPWGLRHAWLVTALFLVANVAAIWWWQPDMMAGWANDQDEAVSFTDRALVAVSFSVWGVSAVVLVVLLAVARAWRYLGPGSWSAGKAVGAGLLALLALLFALGAFKVILPGLVEGEPTAVAPMMQQLLRVLKDDYGVVTLILVVAVVVPLIEELLFRGVLLRALAKHIPFGWANVIQALLFASIHEEMRLFPFYVALATVAGVFAKRSGGLMAPLVLHSANNLVAVLVYLYRA